MAAFLIREHTITPSWSAQDVHGQRIVCAIEIGGRLAEACRPWRSVSPDVFVEDDDGKIVLPSSSAAAPLEMTIARGGAALGPFISRHAAASSREKIDVACAIGREVATVHACHVLHGRICPDSFLVDDATRTVTIVDFTDAVHVPPDMPLPAPAGSGLPHLSPDGGGRAGRPIDHRTDLYALGCVLYQLFAGRAVFGFDDQVALRHAHVAKRPAPLHDVADVPRILSDIVMSLLEKEPERRYQRATDLLLDLETCARSLHDRGTVEPFVLRRKTRFAALADGDYLLGSGRHVRQLLDAVGSARAGVAQRWLVTGAPGIGKTALCRHCASEIRQAGGRVGLGKFEQLHDSSPYLGLTRCFEDLIDSASREPADAVAAMARRLVEKLGDNLAVIGSLVPNLESLVGTRPLQNSLGGFGARERVARSVLAFLEALASPERPLVLFLDDLQWADSASLDLLARLSTDVAGSVMLVGLCRLERDQPDPFVRATAALSAHGVAPSRTDLIALTRSDVEDLLLEVFGQKPFRLEASSLIYGKTLGSPLFICQFLSGLGDDTVLDPVAAWKIDRIAAFAGAPDVVDFLSARIASLDASARHILTTCACFGMSFDLDALSDLTKIDAAALALRLASLIADGFIAPVGGHYVFVHDRVREAAYQLAKDREANHRAVARRLLRAPDGPEAHAFDIVRHLQAAGRFDDEEDLIEGFFASAHQAARRAHAAAAFDLARGYAGTALDCSDHKRWTTDYETLAETIVVKAESTVLRQHHDVFDREFARDRGHLVRVEDRLKLGLVRVLSLDARARFEEALGAGLHELREAGIDLPEGRAARREAVGREFAAFETTMAKRPPEHLFDLPPLADRRVKLAMQILFRLAPSANNTMQPELFALLALRNANLMLRHGRDELASGITMTFALTLVGITGDVTVADRFARVALAMDGRAGRRAPASVSFVYTYFFNHWLNPVETSLPVNLDGMRTAFEMGDVQFGCFHAAAYVMHLAASGAALAEIVRVGREHDRLIAGRIHVSSFHCGLEVAFAEALQGLTAAPTCLSKSREASVADVMREAEGLIPSERGFFLARSMQLAYLFGAFEAAAAYADALALALPAIEGNCIAADAVTFSLLTSLATGRHLAAHFEDELARLHRWRGLNPGDFACRHDLVLAEIARRDGRIAEAIGLYVAALGSADRRRLLPLAALVSEHAGRFFLALGDRTAGTAHLRDAQDLYERWGARAKARALQGEQPDLDLARVNPRTIGDAALHFEAVFSAARSISAEVDLQRLLQTIMTLGQEVSGATYGALVLRRDEDLVVEVVARHGQGVTICDAATQGLQDSRLVPQSIIARVEHERRTLIVPNAAAADYGRDPYIRTNNVVSILCVPLVGRGSLDGVIYLENNLTVAAFDPRSAQALQVLAAQGAVALANARLFAMLDGARAELAAANEDLERRIEARTLELASARNVALEKAADADRASQAARSANEAKSRFLSVVSHEIRTPMNGVLGMLQLLDRRRLADDQKHQVDRAQQSGLALVKLIDGILDYSRLELGVEASHEDFDLRELVDGCVEIFRPSAEAKGVRLDVAVEAPPRIALRSDARGIGRVIMNLVGNAVKFTSAGSVHVAVTLLQDEGVSPMLRLRVADTGIGISDETQARIFEDFVQGDATIARRFGGTGLGLAISRRIVVLLGGTLDVESALGVGSAFKAAFPVAVAAFPAAVGATGEIDAIAAPAGELSLLVVDDDAINREVAAGLLERLGHTVVCAENCEGAIAAVRCCAFDAVLLDLHMPDIDGIETARRIRVSVGAAPCPPLVLLTADVTEASRDRCRQNGFTRILSKPLRLDALAAMLAGLGLGEGVESAGLSNDRPIDAALFAERCEMLGMSRMVRLIRRYQHSSRQAIAEFEEAAARADRRMVVRSAHRLRSASGSLQFGEMEDLAHRLEVAAGVAEMPLDALISGLRYARARVLAAAAAELRLLRPRRLEGHDGQSRRSTSGPSR